MTRRYVEDKKIYMMATSSGNSIKKRKEKSGVGKVKGEIF